MIAKDFLKNPLNDFSDTVAVVLPQSEKKTSTLCNFALPQKISHGSRTASTSPGWP
jgi:hypothetical protein